MNRLADQQCLQIIEFYYQNACSVKKVHRKLFPFYGQFNRHTVATILAIVTKFRPNHQHAYVECERKKMYRPVLMMSINIREW